MDLFFLKCCKKHFVLLILAVVDTIFTYSYVHIGIYEFFIPLSYLYFYLRSRTLILIYFFRYIFSLHTAVCITHFQLINTLGLQDQDITFWVYMGRGIYCTLYSWNRISNFATQKGYVPIRFLSSSRNLASFVVQHLDILHQISLNLLPGWLGSWVDLERNSCTPQHLKQVQSLTQPRCSSVRYSVYC